MNWLSSFTEQVMKYHLTDIGIPRRRINLDISTQIWSNRFVLIIFLSAYSKDAVFIWNTPVKILQLGSPAERFCCSINMNSLVISNIIVSVSW